MAEWIQIRIRQALGMQISIRQNDANPTGPTTLLVASLADLAPLNKFAINRPYMSFCNVTSASEGNSGTNFAKKISAY
jgi:hypothetical protein